MRILPLAVVSVALSGYCNGSVINFDDLTEQIAVTIDGVPISNGGRVSNLVFNGESVSFNLSSTNSNVAPDTGFTQLLDRGGTVSDIFLFSFVNGQATYQVMFGSVPNLPAIPNGAMDLTTIFGGVQGLPNPYYEDGTFQKVATAFGIAPDGNDTFFARSIPDGGVPEPGTFSIFGAAVAAIVIGRRKLFLIRTR